MLFSEIEGLDELKQQLIRSVENQHVAHAQLFAGREGSANLALALAFATYINCENKQENDACGVCPTCFKTRKYIHPDYHYIFPTYNKTKKEASNKEEQRAQFLTDWRNFLVKNSYASLSDWANYTKAENKQCTISIDESRKIIQDVSLKAFESEYKVFFMWLPEYMNESASNSLLKVLEEPPEKTLFFLITNDLEQILPTILSRTQMVRIRPFSDEEIQYSLINQFHKDALRSRNIAPLAEGNLNKAMRLIDELSNDNHTIFRNWMRHSFSADFTQLIRFSEEYHKLSKVQQKGLLQYGMNIIRELLLFHHGAFDLLRVPEAEKQFLEGFAKAVKVDKLEEIYELFDEAYMHIERNLNTKILCLDLGLQMVKIFRRK